MLKILKQRLKTLNSALSGPPKPEFPPDFDEDLIAIYRRVAPFTMTSKERIHALCSSVQYISKHAIEGDIVECGVWKGGSMMAAALSLLKLEQERKLWLFDTFDGMSEPTAADVDIRGQSAGDRMAKDDKVDSAIWAYGALDEVERNLKSTSYPDRLITYVKGKVEDTIPATVPEKIALLRLDTDWYESTHHELTHLYPQLTVGGVLIIDDYGHWVGARKAVDEYIAENDLKILLQRIDYTGRIAIKLEA